MIRLNSPLTPNASLQYKNVGCRVWGFIQVSGVGILRLWDFEICLGFRVEGFKVWGLGLGLYGLGFRVSSLEIQVSGVEMSDFF